MVEHTKEPWSVHSGDIWQGEPDNPIVPLHREIRESWSWHQATQEEEREANARRIVACVNALAGVRDEVLSAVAQTFSRRLSICILIGALQALRDQTAEDL